MSEARFKKQPAEIFDVTVDFSLNLGTSEIISDHTAEAYLGEEDVSADIIDSSSIEGTGQVSVKVKAGDDGSLYKLVVTAITSESNVWEQDILMDVRD